MGRKNTESRKARSILRASLYSTSQGTSLHGHNDSRTESLKHKVSACHPKLNKVSSGIVSTGQYQQRIHRVERQNMVFYWDNNDGFKPSTP